MGYPLRIRKLQRLVTMSESEILQSITTYQDLVIRYEGLHAEINTLIHAHGGATEHMSDNEINHYRGLARQRDELLNEMRYLEQLLNIDDVDDADQELTA
jgi:hypothetical protein